MSQASQQKGRGKGIQILKPTRPCQNSHTINMVTYKGHSIQPPRELTTTTSAWALEFKLTMSLGGHKFFKRFCVDEFHMGTLPYSSFLSNDLLPSLGARINQETRLRRYIISPFDPRYRWWWFFNHPITITQINTLNDILVFVSSNMLCYFRAWEMLLIVLVVYSAWICPFEFAFLPYKQDALFIIDNIVNAFFAIDIMLTFFVAYLDRHSYLLVDHPKKIAIRYLSTLPWGYCNILIIFM